MVALSVGGVSGHKCAAGSPADTPIGSGGEAAGSGRSMVGAGPWAPGPSARLICLPDETSDVLCMAPNFAPAVSGYI